LREKNEAEIEYRKIWTREKRKNAQTRKWKRRKTINVWLVRKSV
jgi:hypothetical protein